MKKIFKMFILLLISIIVLFFAICLFPVQYAVKTPKQKNYIACKMEKATDCNWYIVDENNGNTWVEDVKIKNEDEILYKYGYDFSIADNVYYIYGDFIKSEDGSRVYECQGWDIKYPVKRNTFPFLPKNFTCKLDVWF